MGMMDIEDPTVLDDSSETFFVEEDVLRQRQQEPPPSNSKEEFLLWRNPREVTNNPTILTNPLWQWLVRTRFTGFDVNERFAGPSSFDSGPVWCFARFGRSKTKLPDGRVIYIAGEHEDHYDPDYHIYNDVVVVSPDGNIDILAYSKDNFPPTDFHSATLVGGAIIIVGCLGYVGQRVMGRTPVYKLCLETFKISELPSKGASPGWIFNHSASLAKDGSTILISGGEICVGGPNDFQATSGCWAYELATGVWSSFPLA